MANPSWAQVTSTAALHISCNSSLFLSFGCRSITLHGI